MRCRNYKYNGFLMDEDGTQYSWCGVVSDNLDQDEERQCRHYAPATHADQLRAMTDEEPADYLSKNRGGCRALTTGSYVCDYYDDDLNTDCYKCWLDWLRQEAKE